MKPRKSKRILIITDSMAIPRFNVRYEDTWIYLLKQKFPIYDIIDRPEIGSTTFRLVSEGGGGLPLLERYMPDTIILQMGMTECAPRLFKKTGFEHFFMTKLLSHKARERYIRYVRKRRIRNPAITYIPPEQFKLNLSNYFTRASNINARVIVILISTPTRILLLKSPHIKQNIRLYNSMFLEVAGLYPNVTCLDPLNDSVDIDAITIDEYHLKPEGFKLVLNSLVPLLSND